MIQVQSMSRHQNCNESGGVDVADYAESNNVDLKEATDDLPF